MLPLTLYTYPLGFDIVRPYVIPALLPSLDPRSLLLWLTVVRPRSTNRNGESCASPPKNAR
jgi:hypothetical protein